MSRLLFLFRHAEAEDKRSAPDKDRELTSAGKIQSKKIGTYLASEKLFIDVIISSSAVRTKQTADLAATEMQFDLSKIIFTDILYDASKKIFTKFINGLDDRHHHVLIVGHNPAVSEVTEYFTKSNIGSMATGGIAIIKFSESSWGEVNEGAGNLQKYIYPALIGND